MFGLPFKLGPIIGFAAFAAFAATAIWLVDSYGDYRADQVRRELDPVIALRTTERDAWKGKVDQLLDEAKRLDDDNKEKLKGALAAKDRAEKLEADRVLPAPALERVRNPGS